MRRIVNKKSRPNQSNTRDNIGKGGKVVLSRHQGKLDKTPKKMKNLHKRGK